MNRRNGLITAVAFVAAVILIAVQLVYFSDKSLDNVLTVKALPTGETVLATTDNNRVLLYVLDGNGAVQQNISFSRKQSGQQLNLVDLTMDDTGRLYVLRDVVDAKTGDYITQELWLYQTTGLHLRRSDTIPLEQKDVTVPVRYRWLSISSALILMGDGGETGGLHRTAYDLDALRDSGQRVIKSSRTYPIDESQGVYTATPSGSETVYISKSGKVFYSEEGNASAKELYPGRGDMTKLINYASFIAPETSGSLLMGERESGDILRLNLVDGTTKSIRNGSDILVDIRDYRVRDIALMSMVDDKNFAAVVQNPSSGSFELVVARDGVHHHVQNMGDSAIGSIGGVLLRFVLYFAGIELLIMGVFFVYRKIVASRTIRLKLVFSTVPLLILALILFGTYSYQSYRSSIEGNFEKQVEDEGNLLAALFGVETFNNIGFPMHYNNEDYRYLSNQMATRSIYTDTAYFEENTIYTGVSKEYPCFYPFSITANRDKEALYRRAALTGKAQTGIVEDQNGRRIACVTPIGGSSGTTIFLLETSLHTANMEAYTVGYIRNYLIASALFLAAVAVLLVFIFTKILDPMKRIIGGLESFSKGDRKVRLQTESNDELADISRVFNKMAGDIDVQIYNLKTLSDTYYRFIPQRILQLLERDNLGDVEFGSSVRGKYNILSVNLLFRQNTTDFQRVQELTNRYFAILHKVCDDCNATLLADSINLQSLRIVCPDADSAVNVAMNAIAQVDGYNASCPVNMRLEVSFFLHRADMCFSICGDDRRYIPTLVCSEFEVLARRCEGFRQISSRLIVTSAAYEDIKTEGHFSRFIGYVDDPDGDVIGLYDFFDSCTPALIRLLNDTRGTFDKAMQLYQEERYYDAKNLFTLVLRENQYDNVARHYIFQCEQNL